MYSLTPDTPAITYYRKLVLSDEGHDLQSMTISGNRIATIQTNRNIHVWDFQRRVRVAWYTDRELPDTRRDDENLDITVSFLFNKVRYTTFLFSLGRSTSMGITSLFSMGDDFGNGRSLYYEIKRSL